MRKKSTENRHIQIANDTMYYIYKHIDTDINIEELANSFSINKIHFHNIFKEQMGRNIYETIKSIRLQKASNLLLTNSSSTITEIANMCGYSSQTSFIRAFKQRFHQTPKNWRNGGFKEYSKKVLEGTDIAFKDTDKFMGKEPRLVKRKPITAYYIRQNDYILSKMKKTWQKLQAWIYTNNITEYEQLGVYHDNPALTPHDEWYYVAAIIPKKNYNLKDTNLPHFIIPEALYAVFDIEGYHGDILRFIQWAYHHWLPESDFETSTIPSLTFFKDNHYLNESGKFQGEFYLPIKFT